MENNEIMNYEEVEIVEDDYVGESGSGKGTAIAVAIGAGLTLAVGAGVKFAKKLWAKHKAKKELRKPDEEIPVEDEDLADVVAK